MARLRHAGKCRQRFALRAGCDQHKFFGRVFVDLFNIDQDIVRHADIAKFAGHLGIGNHAAAVDRHLAPALHRQFDDLLDAVDV